MTWIVMAHRTATSVLGRADAPLKSQGKVLAFETEAAARAEAAKCNEASRSTNVFYTVEEA